MKRKTFAFVIMATVTAGVQAAVEYHSTAWWTPNHCRPAHQDGFALGRK